MIETLVIALLALLLVVAVPLILLGVLIKLLVAVVLLPFRLLGAIAGVAVGTVLLAGKLVLGLVGLLFGIGLAIGGALLLPLVPPLLLLAGIWLVVRAGRPRAAART